MVKSVFKSILIGAILGAMAFFVPIFLISLFILFGIARLFAGKRRSRWMYYQLRFAERIRGMTDEEYSQYRLALAARSGYYYHEVKL